MRSRGLISAIAIAVLLTTGFGTIRGLGQDAEHERITRTGLQAAGLGPRTLDELAGKGGSFGGVGAPDRPGRGLMDVKSAHCDGGDHLALPGYPQDGRKANGILGECRTHIWARMQAAVEAAGALAPEGGIQERDSALDCPFDGKGGSAKCRVLEQLGLAFHAAQDFYSHSNWVDPPGGNSVANPPGLNQSGPAPWLAMDATESIPPGLISGCYEGYPEAFYCSGRVKHSTLNKDTKGAARGRNGVYAKAMNAAALDTGQRWRWFEQAVQNRYGAGRGAKILCLIRNDRPAGCS